MMDLQKVSEFLQSMKASTESRDARSILLLSDFGQCSSKTHKVHRRWAFVAPFSETEYLEIEENPRKMRFLAVDLDLTSDR